MTRSSGQGGRSRHVSESLEESPKPQKNLKVRNVMSPLLRNHEKSLKEKVETVVSPSLRNHKRSLKVRENEVVIDAVLRNYKIILVIVAVILSRRIHETKDSSWI